MKFEIWNGEKTEEDVTITFGMEIDPIDGEVNIFVVEAGGGHDIIATIEKGGLWPLMICDPVARNHLPTDEHNRLRVIS